MQGWKHKFADSRKSKNISFKLKIQTNSSKDSRTIRSLFCCDTMLYLNDFFSLGYRSACYHWTHALLTNTERSYTTNCICEIGIIYISMVGIIQMRSSSDRCTKSRVDHRLLWLILALFLRRVKHQKAWQQQPHPLVASSL